MGEVAWTNWSRFDELRVEFDNPLQADSVTEEHWHDSWFFALGLTRRLGESATLRAGVALDTSPIDRSARTPRIPGNDRTWIALGAGWRPWPNVALDAAYTHIFVEDGPVDLVAAAPGNASRGSLSGRYENGIDLLSLQARVAF
jgi:long-chain fatty acid transport protein